ncbi:hypothetical protein RM780_26745 [Streptomyces sp. DSM 44917]|uniref:Integral membrane protein n=1 Tax=Streptomyces boetiae TaxID=3075541 RepID=A0ABU2LG01_9ACTN|nr:hypothetical protein [Streptomyces sp. DSM 44917]MDT0310517.1 hypothetical protein [Streptomyces sp. DSM 44917]
MRNPSCETAAERVRRARARADAVTYAVAGVATASSLVGMWPVTHAAVLAARIPGPLVTPVAVLTLGLQEGTVVACAIRARANVLERGETGVDGVALWVAVSLSSFVSAAEAAFAAPATASRGEQAVTVLVRLAAPVVAGWLWERGLAPGRRAVRGDLPCVLAAVRQRLRAHALSWAGTADADDLGRRRAAARAARLSDRLCGADENALTRRQRRLLRRLRRALRAWGVAHTQRGRPPVPAGRRPGEWHQMLDPVIWQERAWSGRQHA